MSDLRRVIPPSRRSDRSLVVSVSVTFIFLFLAVAKPWNAPARPAVFPSPDAGSPLPSASGGGRVARRDLYDPALFGGKIPDPAWELWPAGYVVDFGVAGPRTIERGAGDDPTPVPSPSNASVFGNAPPVQLGQADNLVVVGINNPASVRVTEIRLWRSDQLPGSSGGAPVRVPIVMLEPPWPIEYFHVIGIAPDDPTRGVGAWPPGTYRIDLLTEPGGETRSVVAVVAATSSDQAPTRPAVPDRTFAALDPDVILAGATSAPRDSLILFEPERRVVPGAPALARRAPCSIGELWRAETTPGEDCSALTVHDLTAIGVRLEGQQIVSLSLQEVDPLKVAVRDTHYWVPGAGLALLTRAGARPLDQGTYRLEAVLAGEPDPLIWYVRNVPVGLTSR